jgi:hypothetical protein
MKPMRVLLVPLLAAATSACGILYTDIKLPRGWRTAAPSEVKSASDDASVRGESCTHSVLWLAAWGDSSYDKALKDALGGRDGIMYDVRSDLKVQAYVLGLYTKQCTILTGKVAKP